MAPLLTLIFQASIQQGTVPDEWKKANVVPIHKKGSRSDLGNYRPVSLTSICCKTLNISFTPLYLRISINTTFYVTISMVSVPSNHVKLNYWVQ